MAEPEKGEGKCGAHGSIFCAMSPGKNPISNDDNTRYIPQFSVSPGMENSDEMNAQFSGRLTDDVNNLLATGNINVDGVADRVIFVATERFFNLVRSDLLNTDPNEFFTNNRSEMIRINVSREERSVVDANSPNVLHR
jgi:hypothetical protein